MTIDDALKEWASERQAEFIDAINAHGSMRLAAKALGISHQSITRSMRRLKASSARSGYAPDHDMKNPAPAGFLVSGVSTYYGKDGKPSGQWVKTAIDRETQIELLREAVAAMIEDITPAQPVKSAGACVDSLATVYTLTDSHVGALCWHQEGGADWDLKIAEETLSRCFGYLVDSAPSARVGVIAQLGDFLHQDGLSPVTPLHGHVLDADSRFAKTVRVAIKTLRYAVDCALRKHESVVVLMAEGNHDMASSVWLRAMFSALYENEPRVTVIDSPLPYYAYQHGETMIAWHHGHLKKNDQLPMLFASQFSRMWGDTRKRYAHTGHRHHAEEKEHSGMTVIQHPTLAARDAYAARGGWISERAATAITYHDLHGQVSRVTVTPEMVL